MEENLDKLNRRKLAPMRLQVFVSTPSKLSPEQDDVRSSILDILDDEGFAPRTLGASDTSGGTLPLAQVCVIASHCVGGVILGFEQMHVTAGTLKRRARNDRNVDVSQSVDRPLRFPTSWNHIEAGILFALGKPLLIMCEAGIDDGVFYRGAAGRYIYTLPANQQEMKDQEQDFRRVIKDWRGDAAKLYKDAWPYADRH
jgi:hypothetical protein